MVDVTSLGHRVPRQVRSQPAELRVRYPQELRRFFGDSIFGRDMKLDNEQPQEWFPAPAYTDDTYARRGESTTLWLQRSTVARAVACRRFLNENLSVLPRAHQSVLYQALHDRWHSAFFELIVARTLQVLGADIEVEPHSNASTRIDFLARFPDRTVSVQAVAPVINASTGEEAKRRNPLLDVIDSLAPPGWTILVMELPDLGPSDSKKRFKEAVNDLLNGEKWLEGVMNSADKPHWDADSSVSSVLRRSPVFRISKSFLSKFITPSRNWVRL